MAALDVVGTLFPGLTAAWLRKRAALAHAQRLYEAAQPSQYRRPINNQTSGDGVMNVAGPKLREISRHLDENHDLAVAVLDDLVNNTVGAGITVAPMVRNRDGSLAEDLNDELAERWAEWCEAPEVTGELSWNQVERMAALCQFRDGELFVQHVKTGTYPYRTAVRYVLELLEADMVPMDYQDPARNVLHGVQCNDWNAPIAYYVWRQHPGDPVLVSMPRVEDLKVLPASLVTHLKYTRRLRQRRGVPVLHAALNRIRDIKEYEEYERIAARVAASLTWFVKKTTEYQGAAGTVDPTTGTRNLQMNPGQGFELGVGEDIGTIKSDRPNTALVDFREAMLRAVAGGTGTRFSSIARNYNGTYSAQRQEMVEGAIAYRVHGQALVARFHRPTYRRWLNALFMAGAIRRLGNVDRLTLERVDFRLPSLPWIDPAKEASAYQTLVAAGLESRAEIMRQRGRDPAKVWEEIEEEQASGLFASAVAAAAPAPAEEPDADDEDADADEEQAA